MTFFCEPSVNIIAQTVASEVFSSGFMTKQFYVFLISYMCVAHRVRVFDW